MILIVIALILTISLLAILVVYIIDNVRGKGVPDGKVVALYSSMLSLGVLILLVFSLNEPKAIDVYRGKTTLEITYKDKVPIDSTVVWKNNKHYISNNMEKKELTVRDLIRKLLEFNMDAKVTINLTGVPFPLYSDFSLCWGNDNARDSCKTHEELLETRKTASDVMFDFTAPEK